MSDNETLPDINFAPTERVEVQEPPPRKLNVASLLANQLDWLQVDINNINEHMVAAYSRLSVALAEIKADVRFVWVALFALAGGFLVLVAMLGVIIYQLGILIGR